MATSPVRKLGSAEIAAQIRRQISEGILLLNDRLPPERQLAETYRVARGTIREALNKLSDQDYVEIRPGSGTYVVHAPGEISLSAIENANPLELMDARFALEPHICRLAVLHGRRADFARLQDLCAKMEDSVIDPAGFAEADTEFHRMLAQCTHNGLLIWIIDLITSVRSQDEWTRMRRLTLGEKIIAQYNAQHRQILDAIGAREPERAASLMKQHLETARLSLTRAVAT